MKSFWQDLSVPFTLLSPMEGVTDMVFRKVIAEIGRPDVFFTEFTSCSGLLSKGREKVAENLLFDKNQMPIVAQIWGTDPKEFFLVAKQISKLGFPGIDINMGCPVKAVTKHGACSGLIRTPDLASDIIKATIEGAGDVPVSVKTRIGFNAIAIDEWIGFLLKQNISALNIHLRTVPELSKVPAHWELMPQIMKLRNKVSPKTIIIGNGDIDSLYDVEKKYKTYKCEGYMVGTGIFANPWLFNKKVDMENITIPERVDLFLHHIDIFQKQWKGDHNFASLKKFAKTYISNFPDAGNFRNTLMETKSLEELKDKLRNYIQITI